MQIESVTFKNFKVLRDTTLPLSRMTLLIGPNGSGKSTAFEGLRLLRDAARGGGGIRADAVASMGPPRPKNPIVTVSANWNGPELRGESRLTVGFHAGLEHLGTGRDVAWSEADRTVAEVEFFALDAKRLAASVLLHPNAELEPDGCQLAAVLDRMRDRSPERFDRMNEELPRWFPEFDRILFDTPGQGNRSILLRSARGAGDVPASALSEGTLLALGVLTLANLPAPPSVVCMEEPDRGVHPRLLRNIHEALTRLSHPEASGDARPPVQVIATTHSPYFLDLYRDHPGDIVIAEREDGEAKFHRLTDMPDLAAILEDASLGEIWYTGVLGGVPTTK